MAENIDNIPPNAVEVLFAEDLINHIMHRLNGTSYEGWRIGRYRNVIFNAFTDEIKLAVDFLDVALEWESDEEFSKLVDDFQVNEKSFIDYALHHQQLYLNKGFSADEFLHYCVRLGNMSTYFAQHNVPTAPDIALHFIVQALEGRDMFAGGWNTLNVVAKKYIKLKEDVLDVPSPEVSDDESFVDSSEEESDQSLDNGEYFEPNLQVQEHQELDGMESEKGNRNPEVTWKLATFEKQALSNEMFDVSESPKIDSSIDYISERTFEKQTSSNEMFDVSETPSVNSISERTFKKQTSLNEMFDVSETPKVDSSVDSISGRIFEKQASSNEMFDVSETPKVDSISERTFEKQTSLNEMFDVSETPKVDSSVDSILRRILEKQTSPNEIFGVSETPNVDYISERSFEKQMSSNEMFDVSETPKVTSDSNYDSNLMTKKLFATDEGNLCEIADKKSIQD